jgi:EAL domain-containing protein (putative c-di-GMP-specific phosphodiesterase class I)
VQDATAAHQVAERLIRQLQRPFLAHAHEHVTVGASAGVAFRREPGDGTAAEELLRQADLALYQAKAAAKGRAVIFEVGMSERALERLAMQVDLQRALQRGEFRVYYQPTVRLDSGRHTGMEALLRWQHPTRGLIAPREFLEVMEDCGLILPIGRWVLEQACRQAAVWQALGGPLEGLRICVNLSARQFQQTDLVPEVASAVRGAGLDPETLELEITESAVIQHPETAAVTLAALRALGVRVAIDNFGTGYSSLNYLQKLPLDALKIDRSFLSGLKEQGAAAAIVQAAATMAHALGVDVTAEGVETEEQLSAVARLGCDYAQGYLLSRPMPADEAGRLLTQSLGTGAKRADLDRAAG